MKRNANIAQLQSNYLFPEIASRKQQFLKTHPEAMVISLGIGDTTEPIPEVITCALAQEATALSTTEGYTGYGPHAGIEPLRKEIAEKIYHRRIKPNEVFVSDGAKCDIGRLQTLFGSGLRIAVQDPAYPVYVDGSLILGAKEIIYLPCTPENQFFPDLDGVPKVDLIYFCSPNNPTGAVATREQLEKLVQFATKQKAFIIYDSAYASYIQDPLLPKSIYEIEGAKKVAIEVNSFSKLAGFTGVRLGWTIVPEELMYEDGASAQADWNRLVSTIFNGASNIAQKGGLAALSVEGLKKIGSVTKYYLENSNILRETLEKLGYKVYGSGHAPYLWVRISGQKSWDAFQMLLEKYHIVTTPGAGFGPAGEGYLRFTAFGHRDTILEAVNRLLPKMQK